MIEPMEYVPDPDCDVCHRSCHDCMCPEVEDNERSLEECVKAVLSKYHDAAKVDSISDEIYAEWMGSLNGAPVTSEVSGGTPGATVQPQAPELYPKPNRANLAHSLAEFYYLHAYDQNRGVGLTAAHDFLDTHLAGKWLAKLVQPPHKGGHQ